MLKSATSQEVTGNHTYNHVHAMTINSGDNMSLLINGVDSDHMVTKDDNATFTDEKTLQNLTVVERLDAGLVNGVCMRNLLD